MDVLCRRNIIGTVQVWVLRPSKAYLFVQGKTTETLSRGKEERPKEPPVLSHVSRYFSHQCF